MTVSTVKQAGQLYKNGEKIQARSILAKELEINPRNVNAWLAMAVCVDEDHKKKECLQQVLSLDPLNELARAMLVKLAPDAQQSAAEPAPTLPKGDLIQKLRPHEATPTVISPTRLPDHLATLGAQDLETLVATIFEVQGVTVHHTSGMNTLGIDLVVEDESGSKCLIQIRNKETKIGVRELKALEDAIVAENAQEGAIFTSGSFNPPSRKWAEGKPIGLYDSNDLLKMVQDLNSSKVNQVVNECNGRSIGKSVNSTGNVFQPLMRLFSVRDKN